MTISICKKCSNTVEEPTVHAEAGLCCKSCNTWEPETEEMELNAWIELCEIQDLLKQGRKIIDEERIDGNDDHNVGVHEKAGKLMDPAWERFLNGFVLPLVDENKFQEAREFTTNHFTDDGIQKFDLLQFIRAKENEAKS